jgi:hypothetical protein
MARSIADASIVSFACFLRFESAHSVSSEESRTEVTLARARVRPIVFKSIIEFLHNSANRTRVNEWLRICMSVCHVRAATPQFLKMERMGSRESSRMRAS